jgi:hypothetical protein
MNSRKPVLQILFVVFFTSIIAERSTIAGGSAAHKRPGRALEMAGRTLEAEVYLRKSAEFKESK